MESMLKFRNSFQASPAQAKGRAGLAMLLALGIAANLVELAIPRIPVLPWLRLGLAQIFTLAVIVLYSPMEGVRFSVLRTLVAGFISGIPLTSFLFSGAGGIAAAIVMGGLWQALGSRGFLGLVGVSIAGAVTHNMVQIGIAYGLFVQNTAFLWQIPYALIFSLISGGAIGWLAFPIINSFSQASPISFPAQPKVPTSTPVRRKFLFALLLVSFVLVFFANHWTAFFVLFALLTPVLFYLSIPLKECLSSALRFWGLFVWIILTAFLFTPGRYFIPPLTIEGLQQGFALAFRLLFCILVSVALQKSGGTQYLLRLLSRKAGGDSARIVSDALGALPVIARKAREMKWRFIKDFEKTMVEIGAELSSGA
jgi:heptaprenyl diphosphate synthase